MVSPMSCRPLRWVRIPRPVQSPSAGEGCPTPAHTRWPAWSHHRTLIHVASSRQVEPVLSNMQLDNFRAREIPQLMGLYLGPPALDRTTQSAISSGALARGCPALVPHTTRSGWPVWRRRITKAPVSGSPGEAASFSARVYSGSTRAPIGEMRRLPSKPLTCPVDRP